jgi:hypothetical protein
MHHGREGVLTRFRGSGKYSGSGLGLGSVLACFGRPRAAGSVWLDPPAASAGAARFLPLGRAISSGLLARVRVWGGCGFGICYLCVRGGEGGWGLDLGEAAREIDAMQI